MGAVDRKQELFENIARLRRAGQRLPGDHDITTVRLALERELGETVSRRLAARILGVSHTALERWIKTGDLAVVYSPAGRLEVPVAALSSLYEAVNHERDAGTHRHVLARTMFQQRDRARRLQFGPQSSSGKRSGHERASARGLAYHQAVASRLSRPMVREARHVLRRWREQQRIDPRYADRWEQLLDHPLPEIRAALVEESQAADDLRQSSPFAGVLSEPERQRIVQEIV